MSSKDKKDKNAGGEGPRYVVGIDLGTTHTALAYAPLSPDAAAPADPSARPKIEVLAVNQLVAAGTLEARTLLPSFLYLAHESEGPQALPWDKKRMYAVGEHARARGIDAPARVVQSAKSWLCHPQVDRRTNILPAGAPDDVEKVSPVETSFRFLEHLSEAWNQAIAKGDEDLALGKQSIVLTVPASFDAAARELTTEAAFAAGFEDLTLLEEPQAALYAWLENKGEGWRKDVAVGDVILVVDVGGGTTDFSLIVAKEQNGDLQLERVAVGDHILLGGDNMDLLLAHTVETKMVAEAEKKGNVLELDRWQKVALQHASRVAKEALLSDSKAQKAPIAIAGKSSKLVASTLRAEVTRDEVTSSIVDGFFPIVNADARPVVRARAGLVSMGLPYAQDAAITRHLAALLGNNMHPTRILFNGGVMKSTALRERVTSCLESWGKAKKQPTPPKVLEGTDLDLAVARGAAAYGLARRGKGVRIRGGTARAYYVGIEGAVPAIPGVEPPVTALCVAPMGMEEGTSVDIAAAGLGVVVGEQVRFRFFGSQARKDAPGTAVERWKSEGITELSPIAVTLPADGRTPGDVVPVKIRSTVTEIGTLLLEALPVTTSKGKADERWKIELSVREKD
jgi:molecular chaperone DnaK (HSP70)